MAFRAVAENEYIQISTQIQSHLDANCFLNSISLLCFQVGSQIKSRVQELGHGCIYLVQKAGALQMSPTDSFSKRELIEYARAVTEKVGLLAIVGGRYFCTLFMF